MLVSFPTQAQVYLAVFTLPAPFHPRVIHPPLIPPSQGTMTVNTPRIRIAIIGGGIAGAAIANSLIKITQLEVQVYESAPEFSERGAAVGLSASAQRALDCLIPSSQDMLQRAGAVLMSSARIMVVRDKLSPILRTYYTNDM